MSKHHLCQCVIASLLSITATAWAQAPVDLPQAGLAESVSGVKVEGPVTHTRSLFWIRSSCYDAGCHALTGPRCNPRIGKSPSV
jgi:hypothetical protein